MRQFVSCFRFAPPGSVAVLLALVILLPGLFTQAQEFRATLSGQITDPSGALVVNAAVKAVNDDSGTIYTAKTTKEGTYYIPYVLPGTYTVTVTAQGFKAAIQDKVRLFAAQGFGQNFKLEIGGSSEEVVVSDALSSWNAIRTRRSQCESAPGDSRGSREYGGENCTGLLHEAARRAVLRSFR